LLDQLDEIGRKYDYQLKSIVEGSRGQCDHREGLSALYPSVEKSGGAFGSQAAGSMPAFPFPSNQLPPGRRPARSARRCPQEIRSPADAALSMVASDSGFAPVPWLQIFERITKAGAIRDHGSL